MNDDEIKRLKEITDINNDYTKTEELLQNRKWEELQKHIQSILSKYPLEAMTYNTANTIPPKSIQENGLNCLRFLKSLLTDKISENYNKKTQSIL